ncbi:MAG: HU family DNA-binding protein [Candidatus Hydrogenedentes bacterium]|nr:HU family DNA-binding protein [Candidatus Hydrogenedentota bacterium]
MNKGELIEAVAKSEDCSKSVAESAVNAVLNTIKKGVKKDKKVQLAGFGTFSVRKRKARTGRNPRTGETIKIKASKSVGFKAGKAFRESL